MFVAVILLYHLSELHYGLSMQIPRNHYSWTYGPTANLCTNSRVFQGDRLKFNSSGRSLEPGRSRMQTSHAMARDATAVFRNPPPKTPGGPPNAKALTEVAEGGANKFIGNQASTFSMSFSDTTSELSSLPSTNIDTAGL